MATWGISGVLTNNGDVVQDPPSPDAFDDQSTCAIDVVGNYNGNIVVEVCGQNHVWYPVSIWKTGDPVTSSTMITGPGLYRCNISAMVSCRARLQNNTSGTAEVTLYATPAYIEPVAASGPTSLPMYDQNGNALPSTAHIVQGSVTATSTVVNLTFNGAAVFTNNATFTMVVIDQTTFAEVPLSTKNPNGVSFAATSGRLYTFMAVGS